MAYFSSILVAGICMDDWTRYQGSCYLFANHSQNKVSWQQAVQECTWNQSHLVIIETEAENNFLIGHLKQLNMGPGRVEFWTYGNDIHLEHSWNWGITPNPITLTGLWAPGEPNDDGVGEDCLTLQHNGSHYAWNDEKCHEKLYYICETEDPVDTPGGIVG
ncbi:plasmacytoid dendritic cell antigen processing and presentation [Mactra antiquata]